MTEEKRIVEVAINFVTSILSKNVNIESINELYEIKHGNKDVLLEQLIAIYKIIKEAIEIIRGKNDNK